MIENHAQTSDQSSHRFLLIICMCMKSRKTLLLFTPANIRHRSFCTGSGLGVLNHGARTCTQVHPVCFHCLESTCGKLNPVDSLFYQGSLLCLWGLHAACQDKNRATKSKSSTYTSTVTSSPSNRAQTRKCDGVCQEELDQLSKSRCYKPKGLRQRTELRVWTRM